MLKADYYSAPTDLDLLVFEKLIPADHYLRRLKAAINFEPFRALVADCYAEGLGAPAADPVRLLKLSLLQFQYDLSDNQVLRQAQVNVAFRFFLDLSLESLLPVPSLLSQFRTRLGVDRFTRVFNEILRQGRVQGLVRDRLRLMAQTREQVLRAAACFAAAEVAAQRVHVEALRAASADMKEEQRLLARVVHLRELVVWGEQWQRRLREAAARHPPLVSAEQEAAFSDALE